MAVENNKEILILSIDTATRPGGVAVLRGGTILFEKKTDQKVSQSVQLLADIEECLALSNLKLNQIDLIAATTGPGSFTGLRIGIATAKALVNALKIAGFGVSTLEAAAFHSINKDNVCVILPAGRVESFVQTFNISGEILEAKENVRSVANDELFDNFLSNFGNNYITSREKFNEISSAAKYKIPNIEIFPENLAVAAGKIAHRRFIRNQQHEVSLNADYVRGVEIGNKRNE